MDGDPFTIRIFVVDGDSEGVRLVDRMNWTGVSVVFPRERWQAARSRPELGRVTIDKLLAWLAALGRTVEIEVKLEVEDGVGRITIRSAW